MCTVRCVQYLVSMFFPIEGKSVWRVHDFHLLGWGLFSCPDFIWESITDCVTQVSSRSCHCQSINTMRRKRSIMCSTPASDVCLYNMISTCISGSKALFSPRKSVTCYVQRVTYYCNLEIELTLSIWKQACTLYPLKLPFFQPEVSHGREVALEFKWRFKELPYKYLPVN